MGKHARLGPSNHRWPNCPGSVREEAAYPDIAGEAAIDGTGSHLLLEMCLKHGASKANVYLGQIIGVNDPDNPNGWLVDEARCERVQMCLDYVKRRHRELIKTGLVFVEVEVETKSNPGEDYGRHDWWGTVDITLLVKSAIDGAVQFVEVIDYKDGRMWVNAKDNTQLISYLGGKLSEYEVDSSLQARMTIVQPKTNPVVRYDDTDIYWVEMTIDELATAAALTDDPDAPLIPDNKGGKGYCRWCKHKPNCTAQSEKSVETMKSMSKEIIASDGENLFELVSQSIEKVSELTSEQLVELSDTRAGIMSVFDKVDGEIERRIGEGILVSGFDMTPGKSKNVWNESEEDIVKALRGRKLTQDDFYPKKLASPAQILKNSKLTKEQKEKIEKKYITKVAGSLKLTRVAHTDTSAVMFDDLYATHGSPLSVATSDHREMKLTDVVPDCKSLEKVKTALLKDTVVQSPADNVQSKSLFDEPSFF